MCMAIWVTLSAQVLIWFAIFSLVRNVRLTSNKTRCLLPISYLSTPHTFYDSRSRFTIRCSLPMLYSFGVHSCIVSVLHELCSHGSLLIGWCFRDFHFSFGALLMDPHLILFTASSILFLMCVATRVTLLAQVLIWFTTLLWCAIHNSRSIGVFALRHFHITCPPHVRFTIHGRRKYMAIWCGDTIRC